MAQSVPRRAGGVGGGGVGAEALDLVWEAGVFTIGWQTTSMLALPRDQGEEDTERHKEQVDGVAVGRATSTRRRRRRGGNRGIGRGGLLAVELGREQTEMANWKAPRRQRKAQAEEEKGDEGEGAVLQMREGEVLDSIRKGCIACCLKVAGHGVGREEQAERKYVLKAIKVPLVAPEAQSGTSYAVNLDHGRALHGSLVQARAMLREALVLATIAGSPTRVPALYRIRIATSNSDVTDSVTDRSNFVSHAERPGCSVCGLMAYIADTTSAITLSQFIGAPFGFGPLGRLYIKHPERAAKCIHILAYQLYDCLAWIHDHDVLHLNISPDSILLTRASGFTRLQITDLRHAAFSTADSLSPPQLSAAMLNGRNTGSGDGVDEHDPSRMYAPITSVHPLYMSPEVQEVLYHGSGTELNDAQGSRGQSPAGTRQQRSTSNTAASATTAATMTTKPCAHNVTSNPRESGDIEITDTDDEDENELDDDNQTSHQTPFRLGSRPVSTAATVSTGNTPVRLTRVHKNKEPLLAPKDRTVRAEMVRRCMLEANADFEPSDTLLLDPATADGEALQLLQQTKTTVEEKIWHGKLCNVLRGMGNGIASRNYAEQARDQPFGDMPCAIPRTTDLWSAALVTLQLACLGYRLWGDSGARGEQAANHFRWNMEDGVYDWNADEVREWLKECGTIAVHPDPAVITKLTKSRFTGTQLLGLPCRNQHDHVLPFKIRTDTTIALSLFHGIRSGMRPFRLHANLVELIANSLSGEPSLRPEKASDIALVIRDTAMTAFESDCGGLGSCMVCAVDDQTCGDDSKLTEIMKQRNLGQRPVSSQVAGSAAEGGEEGDDDEDYDDGGEEHMLGDSNSSTKPQAEDRDNGVTEHKTPADAKSPGNLPNHGATVAESSTSSADPDGNRNDTSKSGEENDDDSNKNKVEAEAEEEEEEEILGLLNEFSFVPQDLRRQIAEGMAASGGEEMELDPADMENYLPSPDQLNYPGTGDCDADLGDGRASSLVLQIVLTGTTLLLQLQSHSRQILATRPDDKDLPDMKTYREVGGLTRGASVSSLMERDSDSLGAESRDTIDSDIRESHVSHSKRMSAVTANRMRKADAVRKYRERYLAEETVVTMQMGALRLASWLASAMRLIAKDPVRFGLRGLGQRIDTHPPTHRVDYAEGGAHTPTEPTSGLARGNGAAVEMRTLTASLVGDEQCPTEVSIARCFRTMAERLMLMANDVVHVAGRYDAMAEQVAKNTDADGVLRGLADSNLEPGATVTLPRTTALTQQFRCWYHAVDMLRHVQTFLSHTQQAALDMQHQDMEAQHEGESEADSAARRTQLEGFYADVQADIMEELGLTHGRLAECMLAIRQGLVHHTEQLSQDPRTDWASKRQGRASVTARKRAMDVLVQPPEPPITQEFQSAMAYLRPANRRLAARIALRLAEALEAGEDFAAAEEVYTELVDLRTKFLGADHAATALAQLRLGAVKQTRGDANGALVLVEGALETLKWRYSKLGPHAHVTWAQHELALVLLSLRRFDDARMAAREAVETRRAFTRQSNQSWDTNPKAMLDPHGIFTRTIGMNDTHLVRDTDMQLTDQLMTLAMTCEKSHKVQEAVAVLEEVAARCKIQMGPLHPLLAETLERLAELHANLDDRQQALVCFDRALKIRVDTVGVYHPSVASVLNRMALILQLGGQVQEAANMFRRVLEIGLELHKDEPHPDMGFTLLHIGNANYLLNDMEAAKDAYEDGLRILHASERMEDGHPNVVLALNNLASIVLETRDDANASLSLLQKAEELITLDVWQESISLKGTPRFDRSEEVITTLRADCRSKTGVQPLTPEQEYHEQQMAKRRRARRRVKRRQRQRMERMNSKRSASWRSASSASSGQSNNSAQGDEKAEEGGNGAGNGEHKSVVDDHDNEDDDHDSDALDDIDEEEEEDAAEPAGARGRGGPSTKKRTATVSTHPHAVLTYLNLANVYKRMPLWEDVVRVLISVLNMLEAKTSNTAAVAQMRKQSGTRAGSAVQRAGFVENAADPTPRGNGGGKAAEEDAPTDGDMQSGRLVSPVGLSVTFRSDGEDTGDAAQQNLQVTYGAEDSFSYDDRMDAILLELGYALSRARRHRESLWMLRVLRQRRRRLCWLAAPPDKDTQRGKKPIKIPAEDDMKRINKLGDKYDDTSVADVEHEIGVVLHRMRSFPVAIMTLQHALVTRRRAVREQEELVERDGPGQRRTEEERAAATGEIEVETNQEALERLRDSLATSLGKLGLCFMGARKFKLAKESLLEAAEIFEALYGPHHEATVQAREMAARCRRWPTVCF